jgi:predicted DNA-binding ribbon-helix-helix protein
MAKPDLSEYLSAPVKKRSVVIAGHTTSVTLEDPFWNALKAQSAKEGIALGALIDRVDQMRQVSLSSALRLYVLHLLEQ